MEPPIESLTYSDDQKIIQFCEKNKTDSRCSCLIPEEGINRLQTNIFSSRYCWYSPCKDSNNFKTSLILEEQKNCNVVVCNVNLGEVQIDDNGILKVENNCLSSKNYSDTIISNEYIETPLVNDYQMPNYFLNSLFPAFLLLGFIFFLKY